MRIKKISDDKIVVQLTDTELERFVPEIKGKVPQASDLHKFLFEVMELVRSETGFDPYHGGQVVVEAAAYPDGMSLVISKIKTKRRMTRDEFAEVKAIRVKTSESRQRRAHGRPRRKKVCENTVFIFDNFSDFESAVTVLGDINFSQSRLFRRRNSYALSVSRKLGERECNILSEYALKTVRNDICAYNISEMWNKVADGNELAEMAKNLRDMN